MCIRDSKYVDMFNSLSGWPMFKLDDFVQRSAPVLKKINDGLVKIINEGSEVLPCPYSNTFKAFEVTDEASLKVVILGQDPYFSNKNQANGLAFSVNDKVAVPPSLNNIFKELASDIPNFTKPSSGDLTAWAKQGVLLLNTSLTVLQGDAGSHTSIWRPFTNLLIQTVSKCAHNVIFVLWGTHAKEYKLSLIHI